MADTLRNIVLIALGLLCGVGAALLVAENQQPLQVHSPLFEPFEVPMWAALAVAFGLGVVMTALATAGVVWSQLRSKWALKRQVREMEGELTWLRNLPLETLADDLAAAEAVSRRRRPALPPDAHVTEAELLPASPSEGSDPYEAFLEDGEGFDAVEAQTYLGEAAPGDPYAVMFDQVDPAVRDMDEAQLSPAVVDRAREGS